jgi:hypothetical protein
MSDCKHEYESASKSSGGHDFRYEFAQCSKCPETLYLGDLIDEFNRSLERVKEFDIQLSEAKNLLGLALATFNASQGNSKIIISEWLKENDK